MLSLRTLLRHPIQFAIMTFGIALGVAVMVSIDLANASAARAFDLSTSAITGRATHSIVGSDQSVDESLYVRLRTDPAWRGKLESAPLVSAYAASPQLGNVPFTLLGMDPFAEAPFRSFLGAQNQTVSGIVASLLLVPGSILLSASTAQQYGLHPCSPAALNDSCRLMLSINGETREVHLTGLLIPSDNFSKRATETLILTDIATAQSLTGTIGKLTQIDLILPDDFYSALQQGGRDLIFLVALHIEYRSQYLYTTSSIGNHPERTACIFAHFKVALPKKFYRTFRCSKSLRKPELGCGIQPYLCSIR